jgi:hypothetical protein
MTDTAAVRRLGAACIAAGIAFFLNGIWEVLQPSIEGRIPFSVLDPAHFRVQFVVFAVLCAPGFFAGQLGFYQAGAAGRSWFAKAAVAIAGLGACLYITSMLSTAVTLQLSPLQKWGVPLAQWLSPVLLGVAALFTKRVAVWKRIWPIWLGVAPSILFPLYISVLGWPAFAALATSGLNWVVFGFVVRSLAPRA